MLSPSIQFGRLLSVPSSAEIRPYLLNEAGKAHATRVIPVGDVQALVQAAFDSPGSPMKGR
jgi:hypothetical protein